MINFIGLSKFYSILRQASLALACLASAGMASATVPVVQGRWEFVVTSGDTSTQLSTMGQSIFSTYLLQNGTALTDISAFTYDTVACDTLSNNNITVTNGSVDALNNVIVDFTVSLSGQTPFHYVFTGVLAQGPPKVITGTYQRSAGGCTQGSLGTGTPDGNFTATWFPDPSGQTWMGAFDAPVVGTGPSGVSANFTLTTNAADKTLSGTITILGNGLVNSSGVACIAPDGSPTHDQTITLQPLPIGVSQAAGAGIELFGTDVNGTQVYVNAYDSNPDGSVAAVGEDNPPGAAGTANDGTNNAFTAFYGITGGPCDGLGGGDAPFVLVTKTKKLPKGHDGQHGRDGQRGPGNGHMPSVHSKEK